MFGVALAPLAAHQVGAVFGALLELWGGTVTVRHVMRCRVCGMRTNDPLEHWGNAHDIKTTTMAQVWDHFVLLGSYNVRAKSEPDTPIDGQLIMDLPE